MRDASASGERCSAPGSVIGIGQQLERMAQVDDKDLRRRRRADASVPRARGATAPACAESCGGASARPTKKPRMPRTSRAPENRPTQFSRLGSRLRASPNRRPAPSSALIQRHRAHRCRRAENGRRLMPFCAGNRRSQRGQAGHELGNQQRDFAAAAKGVLRPAHANRRLQRKLAENPKHVMAVAPTDQKPAWYPP